MYRIAFEQILKPYGNISVTILEHSFTFNIDQEIFKNNVFLNESLKIKSDNEGFSLKKTTDVGSIKT